MTFKSILKNWAGPLSLILLSIIFCVWWYFIYSENEIAKLTVKRNNLPDTTYIVVPSYTRYFVDLEGDTTFYFYDRKKKLVYTYKQK